MQLLKKKKLYNFTETNFAEEAPTWLPFSSRESAGGLLGMGGGCGCWGGREGGLLAVLVCRGSERESKLVCDVLLTKSLMGPPTLGDRDLNDQGKC